MGPWFTILCTVLGSTGLSTVLVAVLQRHWQKKDKRDRRLDALVDAQQVMMIDRVRYLGHKYINAHGISLADKENLQRMYQAYKDLGGNGHLETVMAEVDRLEVRG